MIAPILKLLGSVFTIWEHKEKRKYQDKVIKLEKAYYDESKKDTPNNALLDDIEFELHLIVNSVASEIKGQASSSLQK